MPKKSKADTQENVEGIKSKEFNDISPKKVKTKKDKKKKGTQSTPKGEKVSSEAKASKSPVKKIKRTRTPVTPDSYDASIQSTLDDIDAEIDRLKKGPEKSKGIKFLRGIRKDVVQLQKKAKRLVKAKRTVSRKGKGKSGFDKKCSITSELASFLKIEEDKQISRIDATRAICVYIHLDPSAENKPDSIPWQYLNKGGKRNLQDKNNRRVVLPDEKLAKLLRYDQYRKDIKARKVNRVDKKTGKTVKVTDDKLYYYVVNKLIQCHFIKEPVAEKVV